MGYEWLPTLLAALAGIEPYEVRQVVEEGPSVATSGHQRTWPRVIAGVWGTTRAARHLIVVIRPTTNSLDWLIVGATEMNADQVAEFQRWEDDHD